MRINRCLFFLAKRFLGRRHQESFIWFTGFISVIGIALGVASLMLVLGVMNGFSNDLRRKIVGANPHIVIEGDPYIYDYEKITEKISSIPEITGISYFAQTQVLYKSPDYMIGGYLRGIEGNSEILNLKQFIKQGDINNINSEGVILGSELAKELGVSVGDVISVIGGLPPEELSLPVIGIIEYGIYNIDVSSGIINLKNFQDKFFSGRHLANIGITVNNIYHSEDIAKKIKEIIKDEKVSTWMRKNKILFAALALEKKAMLLILSIIIIVASFNITSSLMMTVYRKIKEIGVLKTLGMTTFQIRAVFLIEGFLIGIRGLIYGLCLGGVIIWALKRYNIIRLPEFIYSISYLPLELSGKEIFLICATVFIMTIIASVFPAYRAGKLKPATALRYE
ncbi:MAG TPA: ABC transporter permease [Candidatus Ratteibacteria bacterium]|uniref:Lipoprotein-releasing system transmembrane protein LolC n=1 Tax=candidate division TA06 bacterium ADurb.Bin131 TaxID=1852827 RepID=A0A1V6CD90_UNCT6|nr:MAG: Lipoprotein-releasing system transmembrane protein LolC [candidate division TA06 bacterium ADurb.Bin131]HOC03341.1 ABC transporter permease [bacterium]HRS06136.1 ABC transporter permease [Candidatus Ratteibacteria bacterium]HON05556.1 ABC transporter permease [bacterium]HOQ82008.1 ABC transporter permease [bacterium]